MADFLAEAVVVVKADTKTFRAEFEKQVKAAERQKVAVKMVVDPTGFRTALIEQVRISSKNVVARVRVLPDFTGFRSALIAGVKEAQRGVAVTAGTGAAATARVQTAAVATGGVVDKRTAEAQKAVNTAVDAGIASRRRYASELSDSEKRAARLVREQTYLKASQDAVTKSILSGNAALVAEAEKQQRAAQAAVTRTEQQVARAAAATPEAKAAAAAKEAEAAAKAQATADAELLAARRATTKAFDQLEKEQTAQLNAATKAAVKYDADQAAAAKVSAAEISDATKVEVAAYKQEQAAILANEAVLQKDLERRIALRKEAKLATQQAASQVLAAGQAPVFRTVPIHPGASQEGRALAEAQTILNRETAIYKETVEAATAADTAYRAALQGTDVLLKEQAASTLAAAEAQKALQASLVETAAAETTAAEAALRSSVARAGVFDQIRRAVTATSATLVGLRGAALSAGAPFLAAAAATIAFVKAVKSAADLTSTLNVLKVTAGATASEMKQVSDAAKRLGADFTLPGVTAADAADAMTLLVKAGLSVQDSIAGARGTLQLATAAQLDNAQATQITASALNAFGLSGDQAIHVADLLANASTQAQGSIGDMGDALRQSAAAARLVGLSVDDTVSLLTLLARNGIQGSDAGTVLRVALLRLVNPTKAVRKELEGLNVQIRDTQGNVRPQIFSDLAVAVDKLGKSRGQKVLADIFGTRGVRGAAILGREGAGALERVSAANERAGKTAEIANARMTGLTGAAANLSNQIESLGLSIGSLATGPLTLVADVLARDIALLDKFIQKAKSLPSSIPLPDIKAGPVDTEKQGRDLGRLFGNAVKKGLGEASVAVLFAQYLGGIGVAINATRVFQDVWRHFNTKQIEKLNSDVQDAVNQFNALGGLSRSGNLERLLAVFSEHSPQIKRALQDGVIDPLEKTQLEASLTGRAFLKALPRSMFVGLGAAAKRGLGDFPESVRAGIGQTGSVLRSAIEDMSRAAVVQARQAGEDITTSIAAGLQAGIHPIEVAISKIQEQIDLAAIAGNQQAQLRLFQEEARRQAEIAKKADAAAKKAAGGPGFQKAVTRRKKAVAAQRAAIEQARSIQQQIKSDAEQAARDAQQKAKDAQDARDKADQAFLDSLTVKREKGIDLASIKAQGTARLSDDLKVLLETRKVNLAEQKSISENVKNKKTQGEELRKRALELQQINNDIKAKRQEITDALIQGTEAHFQARFNLAEARGDINAQIKLINERIKGLDQVVKRQKLQGDKLREVRTTQAQLRAQQDELRQTQFQQKLDLATAQDNIPLQLKLIDQQIKRIDALIKREHIVGQRLKTLRQTQLELQQQQQDIRDQSFSDRTALAQSIFDLTGNKSPLLKALDAEIANKRKEITAAQKAHKSTIKLRTELNQLLLTRKQTAEDVTKNGTTAFDILSEAAQTFINTGGNLIGGNQPFAGPTGFTADIAQFLKRAHPGAAGAGRAPTRPGNQPTGFSELSLSTDKATRGLTSVSTAAEEAAKGIKKLFVVGHPQGLVQAGNIDLLHRPRVRNTLPGEGGYSTVRSITVGIGKLFALIPTVLGKGKNARIVSDTEAKKNFLKTGQNLGIFKTEAAANKYARTLHLEQARLGGAQLRATQNLTAAIDRNTAARLGKTPSKKDHPKAGGGKQPNFQQARTVREITEG